MVVIHMVLDAEVDMRAETLQKVKNQIAIFDSFEKIFLLGFNV